MSSRFWLDLTENDIIFNMSDTGWAKAAYSSVFGPWVQGACVFVLHNEKFEPVKTSEVKMILTFLKLMFMIFIL